MIRVVAIIRDEKLTDVKDALVEIDCGSMTVNEVKGRGKQLGIKESYRGSNYCIDLLPKTKIELIIKKESLEKVLTAIQETGRTGEIGDGKIFLSKVEEVIRIRTGERGYSAI
ncbi:MAG: P-II family nitrogen regulator [Methanobrevibacter sp.]|nr:P-II family nitrogen regulator [Methanobrevibacter sp.]